MFGRSMFGTSIYGNFLGSLFAHIDASNEAKALDKLKAIFG